MSIERMAALGVIFSVPAIWIWRRPASRWARLARNDAWYTGGRIQPFAALRTVPSLLGSLWVGLTSAGLIDIFAPHAVERLPGLLGFVAITWWVIIPVSVYVFGHPVIFIPPPARQRYR